jgi:integrase
VRTSELIGAKWAEFDLEAGRWNIPAERMKMRTPHIVPLPRQAVEVLGTLGTLTGASEWLFPGDRNASKPMSNNTILKALERMGYKGRMTGHGFRGLASTILHEQGYNHDHIELQLAHAPRNAVSAAYNHALYLEPRAKMMQEWADFLEQTQRGGKVLSFRGTAA